MKRLFNISAILLIASTSSALANCNDADLCSAAVCRLRQAQVHPTCDQPRSCTSPGLSQAQLLARRNINAACLSARLQVSACFSNPDAGHNIAIQGVQNAIRICDARIDEF